MINALMTRVHAATHSVTRVLRGEAVTLHNPALVVLVEITDAVVTLDPVTVSRASGPAERTGVLRLAATHHANAVATHTCIVRNETWDVLSVGDVFSDSFRVQISRRDQDHPNIFDINDNQAVWSA